MKTRQEIIADITAVGLFVDCRGNLYGPEYEPYTTPNCGTWQHPDELADLLLFLADKPITSFLNIGTFNGCTFNLISDFLMSLRAVRCVTLDPINHNPDIKPGRVYATATSDEYADQSFDLVFIDGNHAYDGVMRDYHNVGRVARYCVFHDIDDQFIWADASLAGGSCRAWHELRSTRKYVEFVAPSKPVVAMGIGVLIQ